MPSLLLAASLLVQAIDPAPAAERVRPVLATDASIELEAAWEPCRSSTYGLFESTPALRAPHPAVPRRAYGRTELAPLLPTEPVALGEVYAVDEAAALPFLRQLHPGARSRASRPYGGDVPGTHALVRAVGPEHVELLLRAHAVFELADGVVYKPAQFEGRLVLGRDGAVRAFSLALPSRDTNVDVNVPLESAEPGPGGSVPMAADIGWVPRMEVTSGSLPALEATREVLLADARVALRRAFYRFAALDWLPFEEAVRVARERERPLHLVVLFGALDDDSC